MIRTLTEKAVVGRRVTFTYYRDLDVADGPTYPGIITGTDPETEATHYGIAVCHIGEDGAMLALGHPGKRKAFAAFNRHARVFCGLANLADDQSARISDWSDVITEKWVVFRKPDPEQDEDPDYEWVFDTSTKDDPNAQPVTILRP